MGDSASLFALFLVVFFFISVDVPIGDYVYKQNPNLTWDKQEVIPTPDISFLLARSNDILFLGCDGFFEQLDSKALVKIIAAKMLNRETELPELGNWRIVSVPIAHPSSSTASPFSSSQSSSSSALSSSSDSSSSSSVSAGGAAVQSLSSPSSSCSGSSSSTSSTSSTSSSSLSLPSCPLPEDPALIAACLCAASFDHGSRDNMSGIIVQFTNGSNYHQDQFIAGTFDRFSNEKFFVQQYFSDALLAGLDFDVPLVRMAFQASLEEVKSDIEGTTSVLRQDGLRLQLMKERIEAQLQGFCSVFSFFPPAPSLSFSLFFFWILLSPCSFALFSCYFSIHCLFFPVLPFLFLCPSFNPSSS